MDTTALRSSPAVGTKHKHYDVNQGVFVFITILTFYHTYANMLKAIYLQKGILIMNEKEHQTLKKNTYLYENVKTSEKINLNAESNFATAQAVVEDKYKDPEWSQDIDKRIEGEPKFENLLGSYALDALKKRLHAKQDVAVAKEFLHDNVDVLFDAAVEEASQAGVELNLQSNVESHSQK